MWPPVVRALSLAALTAALAGCGGKTSAPSPPATTAEPVLSASDRAACNDLESSIRIVSRIVSSSVELMTQSLHPKELAKRTGDTQVNLLYAANVLSLIHAPGSLVSAQHQLVAGLRRFAADFGRAQKSVEHNDMAKASAQLADRQTLAKVSAAAQKIDRTCGA